MNMKKLIAALAAASMLASSAAALAAGTEPVDSGAVVMTDAEAPDEAAPEAVEDEAVTEDETVGEAELSDAETISMEDFMTTVGSTATEYDGGGKTVLIPTTVPAPSGMYDHSGDGRQVYYIGPVDGSTPRRTNDIVIKNVNFKYEDEAKSAQLYSYTQGNVTFEDCTFDNVGVSLDGASAASKAVFKDCTFTNVKNYTIKYVKNVTIDSCVFDSCKRALLIRCKDGSALDEVIVKNTTFKNITKDRIIKLYNVVTDNETAVSFTGNTIENTCTAGFIIVDFDNNDDAANNTYKFLYTGNSGVELANLNDTSETTDKQLYFDGDYIVDYDPASVVAAIGDKKFTTLQAAVTAAQAGDTVTLLSDDTETGIVLLGKNITIDGDGHTITSSANRIFRLTTANTEVTIKNITLIGKSTAAEDRRGISVDNVQGVKLNLNNVNIIGHTVENGVITGYNIEYALNFVPTSVATVDAKDCYFSGWAAVNAYGQGQKFDFDNCTFEGINIKPLNNWHNFGTICLEGDTTGQTDLGASENIINLNNCKITSIQTTGNMQDAFVYNNNSVNNTVRVTGDESRIIYDNNDLALIRGANNKLELFAGGYSSDPTEYVADGYEAYFNDEDNLYHIRVKKIAEETFDKDDDTADDGTITVETNAYEETESGVVAYPVTVTFDKDAVDNFPDGKLRLVVTTNVTPNDAQKEAVEEAQKVYDIKVVDDATGEPVDFTGTAEITLKCEGKTGVVYAVYYIDEKGQLTKMPSVYDAVAKTVTFTASHFSLYAIESSEDITENVGIGFRKAAADLNNASASTDNLYDIIVSAKDADKFINELASADLVFNLENLDPNGLVDYEVTAKKHVNLIADPDRDRYEFNYDGFHEYQESGKDIVIGQVRFSGYGKYSFAIDTSVTSMDGDNNVNIVNTTKFSDNIVDTYSVAGTTLGTYDDEFVKNDSPTDLEHGWIKDEIKSEKVPLQINVAFPNDAKEQVKDYNDMKVTLSGGDLPQSYVIDLGSDVTAIDTFKAADGTMATVAEDYKQTNVAGTEYNAYVIDVTDLLTENVAYTVTVEGEGYRTARYTVNMGERTTTTDETTGTTTVNGKTLTFWNNVMDNALAVEKDSSKTMIKNYLAGDIVKDNIINLYDLSAVVSYFGTTNLITANPEYVKYDLNRDGMIDSKDIAYVLVSWEN